MSKWNPIVSGRRAWAALRDLSRRWCLGIGSGPSRPITPNGFSPEAYRARQIIAERLADAARMGARPQLGTYLSWIIAPKNCYLKIPLPIPCRAIFFPVSARKIPLPDDLQIEPTECLNYMIRMELPAMRATNFAPHCDVFGVFSLPAGKSSSESRVLTPRSIWPGGGGRRWPRSIAPGRAGLPRRG
jgi:hypothetical protein